MPCVESKANPTSGAEDGTLQVNEYFPAKRAGHFDESSSSVKKPRPVAWTALRMWSSKGAAPATSWIAALIGLFPQELVSSSRFCAVLRCPSASIATPEMR